MRRARFPGFIEGREELVGIIGVAVVFRLLCWMPYYLPVDLLDYLNALDIYSRLELVGSQLVSRGDTIHIVRLGLVFPLALIRWLTQDTHLLLVVYPLLCSLGLIIGVYELATRMGGRTSGRLAACLMAMVPAEVVYGTIALPDLPLSFFALMTFALLVGAADGEAVVHASRRAFLAGGFLGLAYTCKETALFLSIPALAQALLLRRRLREPLLLAVGLGVVIIAESLILWGLMGAPHIRILEALPFIPGSKGQFAGVARTWSWWLGQIWFKIGALFWAKHYPTFALYVFMPHLLVLALWAIFKDERRKDFLWPLAWGGTWVAQQLLLSSIEQEPRYFQPALPYVAIAVALGLGKYWEQCQRPIRWGVLLGAAGISAIGAGAFWSTFKPFADSTNWMSRHLERIKEERPMVLVGSPYDYLLRLAFYKGLPIDAYQNRGGEVDYWLVFSNGYSKEEGNYRPQPNMRLVDQQDFHTPLRPLFEWSGYTPRVGIDASAKVYRRDAHADSLALTTTRAPRYR